MIIIGPVIIIIQQQAEPVAPEPAQQPEPEGGRVATCQRCGWSVRKPHAARAKQALGAHSRYCKGVSIHSSPFDGEAPAGSGFQMIASPVNPAAASSPMHGSGRVISALKPTDVACPLCDWTGTYDTPTNAHRGLTSHRFNKHKLVMPPAVIPVMPPSPLPVKTARCEVCGWKKTFTTEKRAIEGLRVHMKQTHRPPK